jgi:hypothetical protein
MMFCHSLAFDIDAFIVEGDAIRNLWNVFYISGRKLKGWAQKQTLSKTHILKW